MRKTNNKPQTMSEELRELLRFPVKTNILFCMNYPNNKNKRCILDLSYELKTTNCHMSKSVNRLIEMRLIKEDTTNKNKRQKIIILTEKGKKIANKFREIEEVLK